MEALIPFVLGAIDKWGVPAAAAIYKMFTQSGGPTQADWDNLIKLTAVTARQQMLQTLAAHNIDPASPQGVAFLALTPV